jgi:hypothetical protein
VKRYYGFYLKSTLLSVPCPIKNNQPLGNKIKIGSVYCRECKHFASRHIKKQYVECRYNEPKDREVGK